MNTRLEYAVPETHHCQPLETKTATNALPPAMMRVVAQEACQGEADKPLVCFAGKPARPEDGQDGGQRARALRVQAVVQGAVAQHAARSKKHSCLGRVDASRIFMFFNTFSPIQKTLWGMLLLLLLPQECTNEYSAVLAVSVAHGRRPVENKIT